VGAFLINGGRGRSRASLGRENSGVGLISRWVNYHCSCMAAISPTAPANRESFSLDAPLAGVLVSGVSRKGRDYVIRCFPGGRNRRCPMKTRRLASLKWREILSGPLKVRPASFDYSKRDPRHCAIVPWFSGHAPPPRP